MSFSLDAFGELTVSEAIERAPTGGTSQTINTDHNIDTDGSFDDSISINTFFGLIGIYFISTDNTVSFRYDGVVEAPEFIEGSRTYIDNTGRLTVVFLREN